MRNTLAEATAIPWRTPANMAEIRRNQAPNKAVCQK
jgi:hypothetical protein